MSGRNPEAPRCSWCDARCRSQGEIIAHEAEHRRDDERLTDKMMRIADLEEYK